MKQPNYYSTIITTLASLKELHPTYNMGRHLSTVLDECGDVWGLSDRELSFALSKYAKQLELDPPHSDEDIDIIIKGAMNLTSYSLLEDPEDAY